MICNFITSLAKLPLQQCTKNATMTIKQFDCKNITSNDISYFTDGTNKSTGRSPACVCPSSSCSMSDGPVSQVGAGTEPQPHGASDQDLVPEQEDEVQEELAAADGEQRGQLELGLGGRRPPASSGHSDS